MMTKPNMNRVPWTKEEISEVYEYKKNPEAVFSDLFSRILVSSRFRQIFHNRHVNTYSDCRTVTGASGSYVKIMVSGFQSFLFVMKSDLLEKSCQPFCCSFAHLRMIYVVLLVPGK